MEHVTISSLLIRRHFRRVLRGESEPRIAGRFGLRDRGAVARTGLVWMGAGDGQSPRIRRVQEYVEVRVGEVAGLDELAGVAGLSRYHFARVFREEVGQSPWSYVREARLRRAMDLLREGRSPAEAAHEAGFADQSHLTRTLRAVEGLTPAAYRRAHVRDEHGRRKRDRTTDRKIVQEPRAAPPDHATESNTEASWNRTSRNRRSPTPTPIATRTGTR